MGLCVPFVTFPFSPSYFVIVSLCPIKLKKNPAVMKKIYLLKLWVC